MASIVSARTTRVRGAARATAVLIASTAICGLTVAGAAPGIADPTPDGSSSPPQLTVMLSAELSGGNVAAAGSDVDYTASVANSGAARTTLRLEIDVPDYLTVRHSTSVNHDGKHSRAWKVTVRPGHTVRKSVSARVGTIPKQERRLIGLASVYLHGSRTPLARTAAVTAIRGIPTTTPSPPSSASNPSPTARQSQHRTSAAHDGGSTSLIFAVLGAVVFVAVVAAAGVWWWRRRRAAAVSDADSDDDSAASAHDELVP